MISKLLRRNRCGWNWSWRVRKDIEAHEKIIGKKLNRDEVIEYLFGDFNQYPETNLDIYLLHPDQKTVIHRLNMLWVFPLTIILSPISYITYGAIGWSNKSLIGRFVLKCIGEDK